MKKQNMQITIKTNYKDLKFNVIIDVFHEDREIEFIQFQHCIEEIIKKIYRDKISIKNLAKNILIEIKKKYDRNITVGISKKEIQLLFTMPKGEKMIKNSFVTFKVQKEGFHKFPRAAIDPELQDVSYLANLHRHIFYFYVTVENNDRKFEDLISFKNILTKEIEYVMQSHNYERSCEMISDELAERLKPYVFSRTLQISVLEDDENGSYNTYCW